MFTETQSPAASPAADVRIFLLGTPEVWINGQSILIERRINRSMFFYLASQGRPVSRDELLARFWPEHSEADARARLRETLSRLGKLFENVLNADLVRVMLDFPHIYVDQLRFEGLVKQISNLPWQIPANEPLAPNTVSLMREAVDLWRGPRFLSGIALPNSLELENWYSLTAQRLEHQCLRLLERLAEHARAINHTEDTLRFTQRALQIDPLNEDLHTHLLQYLISMGMWSEGMEHYAYLESLFGQENIPISAQFQDLFRQLQTKSSPESGDQQPAWNIRTSMLAPFVGRKKILDELQRAYQSGGGIVVVGESGLGKTRLLQEFAARAQPRPRVLLTTCRTGESALPYQPIIDLLRESISDEEWLKIPLTWSSQVSLLLPELEQILEKPGSSKIALDPDTAPAAARSRLMEAIRQIFNILAKDRNLLFCLDDAHWADEATLAAIAYLLERPPFDKGLVVVMARHEEHNPALERLFNQLQRGRQSRLIRLPYFSHSEIAELVAHVTGTNLDQAHLNQLAQSTGGNPLYLLETLRAIHEDLSTYLLQDEMHLPVTLSMRTLISSRLLELSPVAFEALQTAAVVGAEFTPEVVAESSQRSIPEMIVALEELEEHQLIGPLPRVSREIRYRFIHSTIREVLLLEINPLRRQWLERHIAFSMEKHLVPEDYSQAAILAQHFESGGEGNRAFEYWVRAGQYARQLFSLFEADSAFAHAAGLIPYLSGIPEAQVYDLFSEWAEMAFEAEDAATIQQLSNRLRQLGEDNQNKLFLGTALNLLCSICLVQNKYEQGLTFSGQAIGILKEQAHRGALMDAYSHQGTFFYMLSQVERSLQHFEETLQLGKEVSTRAELRARANAHYQASLAHILIAEPGAGLRHAQQCLVDFNQIKRSYGQEMAYAMLSLSSYMLCHYDDARQFSDEGLELAERTEAERMLGYLSGFRAMLEIESGDLDAALDFAGRAIQIGQHIRQTETSTVGYQVVGDTYARLGDYATAIQTYRQGLEAGQKGFWDPDLVHRLGLAYYYSGRKSEGARLIQQGIDDASRTGLRTMYLYALISRLHLLVSEKNWEKAASLALELQMEGFKAEMPLVRLQSTFFLGEISIQTGDVQQGLVHLLSAADEATRIPATWVAIPAWVRLAELAKEPGLSDPSARTRAEVLIQRLAACSRQPQIRSLSEAYQKELLGRIS